MSRKWWTLTTVCLGMVMLLLDITIVNVALPSIAGDLGASFTDLQCCTGRAPPSGVEPPQIGHSGQSCHLVDDHVRFASHHRRHHRIAIESVRDDRLDAVRQELPRRGRRARHCNHVMVQLREERQEAPAEPAGRARYEDLHRRAPFVAWIAGENSRTAWIRSSRTVRTPMPLVPSRLIDPGSCQVPEIGSSTRSCQLASLAKTSRSACSSAPSAAAR